MFSSESDDYGTPQESSPNRVQRRAPEVYHPAQHIRPQCPTRKMIHCRECDDLVTLYRGDWTFCKCGASKGAYLDIVQAVYSGESCYPVCLDNAGLRNSIKYQPRIGINHAEIRGWVAAESSSKFKRVPWDYELPDADQ